MEDVPELKDLRPFVFLSTELHDTNPILSFYFKNYACEKGNAIIKKLKSENKDVTAATNTLK
jgi:hypothetical protein